MKPIALLLSLLLAACASNDGFQTNRTLDCGPGAVVTIQVALDSPRGTAMEGMDDQHTLVVLAGNNSHEDIVVTDVRVDQVPQQMSIYKLDGAHRVFNQTIAEGDQAELKIPLTGRSIHPELDGAARTSRSVLLDASVGLANGDRYRCQFEIALR